MILAQSLGRVKTLSFPGLLQRDKHEKAGPPGGLNLPRDWLSEKKDIYIYIYFLLILFVHVFWLFVRTTFFYY